MRRWLKSVVVGLDLCPFANPVLPQTKVHVSRATASSQHFMDELDREVRSLDGEPPALTPPLPTAAAEHLNLLPLTPICPSHRVALPPDEPGTTLFVLTHGDFASFDGAVRITVETGDLCRLAKHSLAECLPPRRS